MAVTFTKVQSTPDILSETRFEVEFGEIPGAPDLLRSEGGDALMLKNTELVLPQISLGHIRVPLFNFQRGFAGHRDHQNRFTASFYEDSKGGSVKTLLKWQAQCRAWKSSKSAGVNEYASPLVYASHKDSTGATSIKWKLVNVWPIVVTPSGMREEGGAAHVEVDFNVDHIDLDGLE